MNIYFLRHAIAVDHADWKGADADRPLTKDGIKKMKDIARVMRAMDLGITSILTSPYRRAYDTAMIAAKTLKLEKHLKVTKTLATDADPKLLMKKLALDYRSWESVLVVGHEPNLSRLISVLIGGLSPAASGTVSSLLTLKKAGLAKLSADSLTYGPCATLEWLLTPKLLRSIKI